MIQNDELGKTLNMPGNGVIIGTLKK